MKKIIIFLFVVVLFTGCIKDDITRVENTDTPVLKFSIVTPTSKYPRISYSPNAGVAQEYLSFENNDIRVKLEGPILAPADVYLDFKTNPAGLTKLNADLVASDPSYKPFNLLPDSCFKIMVTKDTIRKGQQYAEKISQNILVYTQKIDPSVNYILPLTVTSSSYASAVGTGTIYYYIIGNPIAGTYNVAGGRYNCTVSGDQGWTLGPIPASVPANFNFASIPSPKSLTPLSDTLVTTFAANLGAGTNRDYFLGYNPARSTTDISFKLTQSFADGISNIRVFTHSYDPALKKITLVWTYNNQPGGVGNDRIISETFTK